jgi:hypothetical protein
MNFDPDYVIVLYISPIALPSSSSDQQVRLYCVSGALTSPSTLLCLRLIFPVSSHPDYLSSLYYKLLADFSPSPLLQRIHTGPTNQPLQSPCSHQCHHSPQPGTMPPTPPSHPRDQSQAPRAKQWLSPVLYVHSPVKRYSC